MRSAGVDARADAIPSVVDAGSDPVTAVGFDSRAAAAEASEKDNGTERDKSVSHTIRFGIKRRIGCLIWSRPKESRAKSSGQFAAIDLAALVHRNFFDKKNLLWNLPST
jgi:hypothetical protein